MALAARGQRDMDDGPEDIIGATARQAVRRQARRVHAQSLGLALVVVAIVMLLPAL